MSEPRISVAMSVYNNARFVGAAIDSILAQSFRDFEFLIVDDGSSDGSGEIIAAAAAADPRIRAIHQENRGLVASLNRLIDEARAPLIARMDGDDIALPERFERQLAFLDAHPDHGVLGTNTLDMDEQGRLAEEVDQHPLDYRAFLANLGSGPLLCHSSVMMRTDLVRAAGGYRALYRHCEDYDLWLRLSDRTQLCSLPDHLLHYRRSDDQVSCAYTLTQHVGAAIAWLAHCERQAGRPDPSDRLDRLPQVHELDRLDAVFGRPGVAAEVRARVAPNLLYSELDLLGSGLDLIIDHVRSGGERAGLWRTVARLMKIGAPARAARLATALAAH